MLEALGANTLERQILRSAQLDVLAVGARKIFPTQCAGLREHDFVNAEDTSQRVRELLDVVEVGNTEHALSFIVVQA